MYLNLKHILALLLYCHQCLSISTRIWRHQHSCGKPGFACTNKTVIIQCPYKKEYHIYVNEFNGYSTLENIFIKNCRTLTVLFRCTNYNWEPKNLQYLEISNVETLRIQTMSQYESVLPPVVVFENISYLHTIPQGAFVPHDPKRGKCVVWPAKAFHSVKFTNITIDSVATSAFSNLTSFGNVTFSNVRVQKLSASSIVVKQEKGAAFVFENSEVKEVESGAIQVLSDRVVVTGNKFPKLPSGSIDVKTVMFNFTGNFIDLLHREALVVASAKALVSSNRFYNLTTAAFSRIQASIWYNFTNNYVYAFEDGGLLPHLDTNNVTLRGNRFPCDCQDAGWLFRELSNEEERYQELERHRDNTCFSSCNLSVSEAALWLGECKGQVTVNDVCEAITTVKKMLTITTEKVLTTTEKVLTTTASVPVTKLASTRRKLEISTIQVPPEAFLRQKTLTTSTGFVAPTSNSGGKVSHNFVFVLLCLGLLLTYYY